MERRVITWQDISAAVGLWGVLFTVLAWAEASQLVLLASCVLPIMGLLLLVHVRSARQVRFHFTRRSNDRGVGDELLHLVHETQEYILLCHFRDEAPSANYINALRVAKLRGVSVSRLITTPPVLMDQTSSTAWLIEQVQGEMAEHRLITTGADAFYWEVYVFDGKSAALALPSIDPANSGSLPNVLLSDDPEFVRTLEVLFLSYWHQAQPLDSNMEVRERAPDDGTESTARRNTASP